MIFGRLSHTPDAGLLPPDIEGHQADRAVGRGWQSVSVWMEMVVNERVSGEKVLRLLGRFEPLHLPFSASCRSM